MSTSDKSPDVIVIGAGPAGYVCAIRLAQLGKKVLVVERERVGGVCLNWGCIPVKALLHAAQTVRDAAEGKRMGLLFQNPEIDLVALYGWKARIVDRLVRGIEYLFKANGVEVMTGSARFVGPEQLAVTGEQEEMLAAQQFVIATGSKPVVLPGMEPDGHAVIDSNHALKLVELPRRLAIIGAGVIGLEFATLFSRLGAKVTVLELEKQILPGTDPELAALLQRLMQREGISFELGVKVSEIVRAPAVAVRYRPGADVTTKTPSADLGVNHRDTESQTNPKSEIQNPKSSVLTPDPGPYHQDTKTPSTDPGAQTPDPDFRSIEVDKVLVAVGRRPMSDELGLEWAGVKAERGFIRVDSGYRTSNERVFAIGDVTSGPLLAHRAMAEGIALAENIAGSGRKWKFKAMPSCVYTDPELATVGLSEPEAKAQGRAVKVARVPLSAVGRSLTLGRGEGLCKLICDAESDKVLGCAVVGPQADSLIAEAAVAVELGLTAEDLGRAVHPHPTMSELLFEAAEAIHGRAIHVANG